jgi:cysteinyl-tRNA synthetase
MARDLLGAEFDIHGGGSDLLFPHHENEIAQSTCAGDPFARVWLHNEMLLVEGRKMSKSLGNFFTVRDLLDRGIPGEVIRLVFLMTHYRSPMDWTDAKAQEAEATLRKWRRMAEGVAPGEPSRAVLAALADDLNTAGALAELHRLASANDRAGLAASARLLGLLTDELAGWDAVAVASDTEALVERLLADRLAARRARDFARADTLRDVIAAAGVVIMDGPGGSTWRPGPDFDPEKLEALR